MNLSVVHPVKKYPVYPEKLKPLKTLYDLDASLEKEFGYMDGFVTNPVQIVYPTKKGLRVKELLPFKKLVITPSLFRRYSCLDFPGCTRCCEVKYWNIWYERIISDDVISQFPEGSAKKVVCSVDGKERAYWCYDHTKEPCVFSKGMCTIHDQNPISCMFPLVSLSIKERVLRVSKRLYGRNHHMGCPAQFYPYETEEQFEQDTVSRFLRLKDLMDLLEIENTVEQVVDKIREGIHTRLGRMI